MGNAGDGGAIDQFGQVERFAKEVLPLFTAERVR